MSKSTGSPSEPVGELATVATEQGLDNQPEVSKSTPSPSEVKSSQKEVDDISSEAAVQPNEEDKGVIMISGVKELTSTSPEQGFDKPEVIRFKASPCETYNIMQGINHCTKPGLTKPEVNKFTPPPCEPNNMTQDLS